MKNIQRHIFEHHNNLIDGLIHRPVLRTIYLVNFGLFEAVSCIDISVLILMLLRGEMVIIPKPLFRKKTFGKFEEMHATDSFSILYNSLWGRFSAACRVLPWYLKNRLPDRPLSMVLLLWLHILYFYVFTLIRHRCKIFLLKLMRIIRP